MKVVVLIVACGIGGRFDYGETPKQYLKLGGNAVLLSALKRFLVESVSMIRVVINPAHDSYYKEHVSRYISDSRLSHCVPGGELRQDSVRIGLESAEQFNPDVVLIHDGCRPYFPKYLIRQLIAKIKGGEHGVIPIVHVSESVCNVSADRIDRYLDRKNMRIVQTPQAFCYKTVLACHKKAFEDGSKFLDDGSLLMHYGFSVGTMEGDPQNKKITAVCDIGSFARRKHGA